MINALVFSKLYYCCNVWSNTSEQNLNRIQGVQNFAARIVSGSKKFDHISPILKNLRWLPVRQQLYYHHATMAFKCLTGCPPDSSFSKYVQRTTTTKRTTRNSRMLNFPLYKTATGQRTFYYRTVKLWNTLDYLYTLQLKQTLTDFNVAWRGVWFPIFQTYMFFFVLICFFPIIFILLVQLAYNW